MDLNQLAALFQGGNPWLILAGAVLAILWQRLGPKQPGPATPTPPATGRPLLDLLLKVAPLAKGVKPPQLADVPTADLLKARADLDAHLADRATQADAIRAALAPEPAKPVP